MALTTNQVIAPASPTTIKVCDVIPGQTVILSCVSATADVFIGTTSTVTSATGAALSPTGPTTIVMPPTATKTTLWATSGTGTHVVGVVVVDTR